MASEPASPSRDDPDAWPALWAELAGDDAFDIHATQYLSLPVHDPATAGLPDIPLDAQDPVPNRRLSAPPMPGPIFPSVSRPQEIATPISSLSDPPVPPPGKRARVHSPPSPLLAPPPPAPPPPPSTQAPSLAKTQAGPYAALLSYPPSSLFNVGGAALPPHAAHAAHAAQAALAHATKQQTPAPETSPSQLQRQQPHSSQGHPAAQPSALQSQDETRLLASAGLAAPDNPAYFLNALPADGLHPLLPRQPHAKLEKHPVLGRLQLSGSALALAPQTAWTGAALGIKPGPVSSNLQTATGVHYAGQGAVAGGGVDSTTAPVPGADHAQQSPRLEGARSQRGQHARQAPPQSQSVVSSQDQPPANQKRVPVSRSQQVQAPPQPPRKVSLSAVVPAVPVALTASTSTAHVSSARPPAAQKDQKKRLVWTPELHARFITAVETVGIQNAVPKTLVENMNVDGLTTEHVKSHLQKYRNQMRRNSAAAAENSQRGLAARMSMEMPFPASPSTHDASNLSHIMGAPQALLGSIGSLNIPQHLAIPHAAALHAAQFAVAAANSSNASPMGLSPSSGTSVASGMLLVPPMTPVAGAHMPHMMMQPGIPFQGAMNTGGTSTLSSRMVSTSSPDMHAFLPHNPMFSLQGSSSGNRPPSTPIDVHHDHQTNARQQQQAFVGSSATRIDSVPGMMSDANANGNGRTIARDSSRTGPVASLRKGSTDTERSPRSGKRPVPIAARPSGEGPKGNPGQGTAGGGVRGRRLSSVGKGGSGSGSSSRQRGPSRSASRRVTKNGKAEESRAGVRPSVVSGLSAPATSGTLGDDVPALSPAVVSVTAPSPAPSPRLVGGMEDGAWKLDGDGPAQQAVQNDSDGAEVDRNVSNAERSSLEFGDIPAAVKFPGETNPRQRLGEYDVNSEGNGGMVVPGILGTRVDGINDCSRGWSSSREKGSDEKNEQGGMLESDAKGSKSGLTECDGSCDEVDRLAEQESLQKTIQLHKDMQEIVGRSREIQRRLSGVFRVPGSIQTPGSAELELGPSPREKMSLLAEQGKVAEQLERCSTLLAIQIREHKRVGDRGDVIHGQTGEGAKEMTAGDK